MSEIKESIERKRQEIKSESMVSLTVWFCNDTELSHGYNHEYTISNDLTGTSFSYSEYYNGAHYKKYAEDQYKAQVESNIRAIERVKIFLNDQTE